jgi:hypothetical protein
VDGAARKRDLIFGGTQAIRGVRIHPATLFALQS